MEIRADPSEQSNPSEVQDVETLLQAQVRVDKLYDFKDRFFENHSIEMASKRNDMVVEKLNETVQYLQTIQSKIDASQYLLLHGKCFNILPDFSQEAFESLSKCVKLDPSSVEAWNHLGECFWKKRDLNSAKNCFNDALKWKTNKVSLRNLSMIMRALPINDLRQKAKVVEESLDKAKQALQLDLTDGESWMILGNSHLALFFYSVNKGQELQQALKAYSQASKDFKTKNNPDLYHSLSVVHRYLCHFPDCVQSLSMAMKLEPTWEDPQKEYDAIIKYISSIRIAIESKGNLSQKKFDNLVTSINEGKDVGPFGEPVQMNAGDSLRPTLASFCELCEGFNKNVVIVGKVSSVLPSCNDGLDITVCVIDRLGKAFAVSIFNLTSKFALKLGDSVAILEPQLIRIKVMLNEVTYNCPLIRVETPTSLAVNRRRLSPEKLASTVFSFYNKSD